jgi:hypothetical protein
VPTKSGKNKGMLRIEHRNVDGLELSSRIQKKIRLFPKITNCRNAFMGCANVNHCPPIVYRI